jgi:hypothetical protein
MQAPDNQWLETGRIVLVRQQPASAKGVLFVTGTIAGLQGPHGGETA